MFATDSLTVAKPVEEVGLGEDAVIVLEKPKYHKRTPYEVLRSLPRNATPQQQDSAIQAVFKPAEIRYSQRPDTLRLPGQELGRKASQVDELPQYYAETFFKSTDFFKEEVNGGRMGVAGTPPPYNPVNDDLVVSLLLGLVLMTLVSLSLCKHFIMVHMKHFFRKLTSSSVILRETRGEAYLQLLFAWQTGVLLALSGYFYLMQNVTDVYLVSSLELLGIVFAFVVAYYLLLQLMAYWTGRSFFDKDQNLSLMLSRLIVMDIEGLLLLPVVIMHGFFGLSTTTFVFSVMVAVLICKVLSLLKEFLIFQNEKYPAVVVLFYFLALDIVPLGIVFSGILAIGNILKVTY